ncbi:response regulator transcription factor [Pseudonocardia sp. ICBG1293]|uniref:response regulator transcription factor n=1 Tax=Pseudonocardia sp. ICBG1293 TaxID=2844382 RepID=UPI001CC9F107|nr:response regulator transcription factor [Pseudonocardia sp. ICBG1293]
MDTTAAVDLLIAGAHALLPKYAGADRIRAALLFLSCAPDRVIDREILDRALKTGTIDTTTDCNGLGQLTSREMEVLRHVSDGRTNRQIASLLNLSVKTVANHMSSIFAKLDVTDRTQAALLMRSPQGSKGSHTAQIVTSIGRQTQK